MLTIDILFKNLCKERSWAYFQHWAIWFLTVPVRTAMNSFLDKFSFPPVNHENSTVVRFHLGLFFDLLYFLTDWLLHTRMLLLLEKLSVCPPNDPLYPQFLQHNSGISELILCSFVRHKCHLWTTFNTIYLDLGDTNLYSWVVHICVQIFYSILIFNFSPQTVLSTHTATILLSTILLQINEINLFCFCFIILFYSAVF